MGSFRVGLAIAIFLGVVVALFPLYSERLGDVLWTIPEDAGEEEEVYSIEGVVESVDPGAGTLVVEGEEILFKGYWVPEGEGENDTVYYTELLSMIEPGTEVTVYYAESGRWGKMAEELVVNGVRWVKWEG